MRQSLRLHQKEDTLRTKVKLESLNLDPMGKERSQKMDQYGSKYTLSQKMAAENKSMGLKKTKVANCEMDRRDKIPFQKVNQNQPSEIQVQRQVNLNKIDDESGGSKKVVENKEKTKSFMIRRKNVSNYQKSQNLTKLGNGEARYEKTKRCDKQNQANQAIIKLIPKDKKTRNESINSIKGSDKKIYCETQVKVIDLERLCLNKVKSNAEGQLEKMGKVMPHKVDTKIFLNQESYKNKNNQKCLDQMLKKIRRASRSEYERQFINKVEEDKVLPAEILQKDDSQENIKIRKATSNYHPEEKSKSRQKAKHHGCKTIRINWGINTSINESKNKIKKIRIDNEKYKTISQSMEEAEDIFHGAAISIIACQNGVNKSKRKSEFQIESLQELYQQLEVIQKLELKDCQEVCSKVIIALP